MFLLLLLLALLPGILTSPQEPPHKAPSQDAITTTDSRPTLFGNITVTGTSENTTFSITASENTTIAYVRTTSERNAEFESILADAEDTTTSRGSYENETTEISALTTEALTGNTIALTVPLTTLRPFENAPHPNITNVEAAENTTMGTTSINTTTAPETTVQPSTEDNIMSPTIQVYEIQHTTPAQSATKAALPIRKNITVEAKDTSPPEVFRPQTWTAAATSGPELTTLADKSNGMEPRSFWETLKSYFHKMLCY